MEEKDFKTPLLKPALDEDQQSKGRSSSTAKYASINAPGPQLCYSPALGDSDVRSRDQTLTNQIQEEPREEYKVYKRRWYILILYSLISGTQGAVWNTFGPISATAEDAFGWSDATIAMLSNWGPISYLIAGVFFSWMLDVKGLRLACLLAIFMEALGTSLRCITMEPPTVTWLMHVGQALNGLAGPVAMTAPPAVSAVWFPPHQRTTATAIGTMFTIMGVGVSFILGPLLVPDAPGNSTSTPNSSHPVNTSCALDYEIYLDSVASFEDNNCTNGTGHPETREHRINRERNAIKRYMYYEAGWSIALFLLVLIYFPNKPPIPPCASATIQRESFLKGIRQLFVCRRPTFWIVAIVYGVSLGVFNVWASMLYVILRPHGIMETEAGWIGFYSLCGASVVSVVVARFADVFSRIMKWLLIFFYTIGTVTYVVFTLATVNVIPPSSALFYTMIIVGTSAVNGAIPLMFELACEMAYPTGEGTTNGILTIINNFAGLIFLLIFMIPHIGSSWTNYTLTAATAICLPLLALMKENYNRLEIDEHNPSLTAEIIVYESSSPKSTLPD